MRRTLLTLVMVSPLLALAGVPKQCQLAVIQSTRLEQAQQAFRPGDPGEAVRLWDEVLDGSNDGPPCRTVEIVWRIGEFLKVQKEVSPEMALRYLNRGIAAHVKSLPGEDWSLGKVFKTTGHFFRRQGDMASACKSLNAAWRIFSTQTGATTVREQIRAEMLLTGCPPPTIPSP